MGSTCIVSVFKPTSLKQNPVKTIIHGNNTCLFQSLVDCARQFLLPSVGRKKRILHSQRLQWVTSLWFWFKWTTYWFSAGLKHTPATHFPHHAYVLILEGTRSLETSFAAHASDDLELGSCFKEPFHRERFSTWPTELDWMSEFELDPDWQSISDCLFALVE